MDKYIVIYTQGNDYHCSCCRHEWTSHEEFDTLEEVKKFKDDNKNNDFHIDSIYRGTEVTL